MGVVFETWQKWLFLVVLLVDLVRFECFPNAAVVCDIFPKRLKSINLKANFKSALSDKPRFHLAYVVVCFRNVVTVVLLNEARRSVNILPNRSVCPPLLQIAFLVELTTCCVKPIGQTFVMINFAPNLPLSSNPCVSS